MAEDIMLDELAAQIPQFKRATELPSEFVATVVNVDVRPDQRGRKCLYLRLELEDGSQTVVKYTAMHLQHVIPHLKTLGVQRLGDLVGKRWTFRMMNFRIGYPRPIPFKPFAPKKGEKA